VQAAGDQAHFTGWLAGADDAQEARLFLEFDGPPCLYHREQLIFVTELLWDTALHVGSTGVLALSDDPAHVITTIGLTDVIVVRTKDATLVVRADLAEKVKDIAGLVPESLR
jgi:hypothetical protein